LPIRPWIIALVLLAVLVRGGALWVWHERLQADPDGYAQVAGSLVERGEFAVRDVSGDWRLSAYRPPLYPCTLALLGGPTQANFLTGVAVLHLILGVLTVVGTGVLARQWGLPTWQAIFAAGLVLFDPTLLRQSAEVMTETLATCLAIFALLALTFVEQPTTSRVRWSALAGARLGLCILCRPTFLAFAGLVGVVIALPSRRLNGGNQNGDRRAAAWVYFAALAIALSPWIARNFWAFGKPIATTTHGGQTLLRGNNPAYYAHLRASPWGSAWNGKAFDKLLAPMHALPTTDARQVEIAQDRWAYQQAWRAIASEPVMFVRASIARLTRLFGVLPAQIFQKESSGMRTLRYAVGVFYVGTLGLAILGMWKLRGKWLAPPWLWGLLLVGTFTAAHAIYWTDMRMRSPLVPVLALLAAVGMEHLVRNCFSGKGLWRAKPPCPLGKTLL
jgi:hypothetical protein